MKLNKQTIVISFISFIPTWTFADTPIFNNSFEVEVQGDYIRTQKPFYASPTMVDINDDGLQDLVIGQFKNGAMMLLKNTGKIGAPKFESQTWIMTDGSPATVPGVW